MKFHVSSFAIGAAVSAALLSQRMRPLLLDLATTVYRVTDTLIARATIKREDLEDLLAEARARARTHRPAADVARS